MSEPTINPYASPNAPELVEPDARRVALDRLRGPTFGLLLLAGFSGAFGILWILFTATLFVLSAVHEPSRDFIAQLSGRDVMPLLSTLPSCFVTYGAWCMRRGVRYRVAVSAAILSCIPMLSACMWMGIPLGIWALVILRRPDVKAAFASDQQVVD